jgi:DNA uptake protein ComE-like DNA-binding protein
MRAFPIPHAGRRPRDGYVLIAVLIVIVVLSLAAYRYADMTSAEQNATSRILTSAQSKALADSGIHYTAALLADANALLNTLGGNPTDNEAAFRRQPVPLGETQTGYFSIVRVDYSTDTGSGSRPLKYGATDEGGRINLNALIQIDSSGSVALGMLKKLPNMTDDIANSIIDWIDADDNPRSGGAESSYYQGLANPYRCKNGPLDSVEELLLVKGVTPELLFGNDLNRNGRLDPDEAVSGAYSAGWAPFLTVYSREKNTDSENAARVNINGRSLKTVYGQLKEVIPPELAAYIVAYRYLSAPTAGVKANTGTPEGLVQVVEKALAGSGNLRSQRNISSIYQLIGTSVLVSGGKGQTSTIYAFPITDAATAETDLPTLLDKTMTASDSESPARINLCSASPEVIATLPGLEAGDIEQILATRPLPGSADYADPLYQTSAWLYTEAKLTKEKLQALDRYVTGRSQVFRIQSIGYFERGGPMARVEAVVDTNGGKPRIVYYRDLSEWGRSIDPRQQ